MLPIILVLCAFLFLVLFFSIPRLDYKYDDTYNGYIVSKCYGDSLTYRIKDTHKKKNISGVGVRTFYKKNIKEIIFDNTDNIEVIERLAFSECKKLENINISNVKYFERNCFSYCKNLKVEELNAIDIGASTFYGCESISSIKLNDGLRTIGSYAFSKTNIEILDLPSSVIDIYYDAFSDMSNLKEINVYYDNLSRDSKNYINSLEGILINKL